MSGIGLEGNWRIAFFVVVAVVVVSLLVGVGSSGSKSFDLSPDFENSQSSPSLGDIRGGDSEFCHCVDDVCDEHPECCDSYWGPECDSYCMDEGVGCYNYVGLCGPCSDPGCQEDDHSTYCLAKYCVGKEIGDQVPSANPNGCFCVSNDQLCDINDITVGISCSVWCYPG